MKVENAAAWPKDTINLTWSPSISLYRGRAYSILYPTWIFWSINSVTKYGGSLISKSTCNVKTTSAYNPLSICPLIERVYLPTKEVDWVKIVIVLALNSMNGALGLT